MNNIKLIIHNGDGKYWNVTDLLGGISLTDSSSSVCRTLTTTISQQTTDSTITQIGLRVGSSCCFYVSETEIFRGNVIDIDNSNGELGVTIKDIGYVLANAKFSRNFINQTPEMVATDIIKSSRLKIGKLEKTNKKLTRYFRDTSAYEIIMTLYKLASVDNKKKYELRVGIDDISVVERGKELQIAYTSDTNIYDSSYMHSMDELVSGVTFTDKQGKLIESHVNTELFNIYKRMKNVIVEVEDKSKINKELIERQYKGLTNSARLSGLGSIDTRAGNSVHVIDNQTGLVGVFYIDTVTHEWSDGTYKNELELNFENIMVDITSGSATEDKATDTNGSTVGTKDWGHGIKGEQINKLLRGKLAGKGDLMVKFGNMYKVNPMLIASMMRMECGGGFDSKLAQNNNNFGGITGDPKYPNNGKFVKYPSVEVGIERMFRLLSVKYIHDWKKTTLTSIVNTYAPASDGNNPTEYVASVKKWYTEYSGKTYTDKDLGRGVASVEDAHRNIVYGSGNKGQITGLGGIKYESEQQKTIVETARSMVGKGRYTWGGRGGIYATDCSGFVHYCHAKAGVNIGWTTASQRNNGKSIPLSEAKAGDFIVMQSKFSASGRHVVLCVGDGYIIHNGGPNGKPITKRKLYTYGKYTVRRCWK